MPPTIALCAGVAGPERTSVVFGWVFAAHQIGAAAAAYAAGLTRTDLGTYSPAFITAGWLCAGALSLRPLRSPDHAPGENGRVQPQPGIFALGTVEHCYVELDLLAGREPAELVSALAALSGPETTVAGVSVVLAFRPELWATVAPDDAPPGVRSFEEIAGEGLRMPATQHDAWLWISGGARDAVFDSTLTVLRQLDRLATLAHEVGGWIYQHTRDLTGFVDGTENPPMVEALDVAAVADGPGAGASVVLVQQWRHEASFAALKVEEQERVIGRTKPDSIELDEAEMSADSHVSRNVVEEDGQELAIYRRNTAYGGVSEYGTMFVAFCAEQRPFELMLRRMAGHGDGIRDALTRHTTPLTGAYYVAPSLPALAAFLPKED